MPIFLPNRRIMTSVAAHSPAPGGGGGGGGWVPTDTWGSSDLLCWFDASDTATITESGGVVSQINDKSGNSRHFVQATSGKRPTLTADHLNGLDVLTFDGSDDSLYIDSWGSVSQPFTRCMVVQVTAAPDNFDHLINSVNASPNTADVFFSGQLSQEINGSLVNGVTVNNGDTFVRVSEFNGTSSAVTMNGTRTAGGSGGTNGFAGVRVVGLDDGGSFKPAVRIAEFFILDVIPSQADREKIEGYLAHKWGQAGSLPGGHPYKSAAP